MSVDYNTGSTVQSRVENKPSVLLTKDENDHIFRLLGPKCQTLATTVVQLYLTDPPHHTAWVRRDCGILCLVKDNIRRSYFFRLFCPVRLMMVWEHEIYNHFEYQAPRAFLHAFEAEDGIAAFNFADENEARQLRTVLLEKIETKKQRKMERRSRHSLGTPPDGPQRGSANGPSHKVTDMPPLGPKPRKSNQQGRSKWGSKRSNQEKDSARRITKADIGMPLNFRHVSHVGWHPNKGFEGIIDDPQMKDFFVKAGVSESQLKDQETREFIFDFIHQNGGIDAVKESFPRAMALHQATSQVGPPPPVPARSVPLPPELKPGWGGGQIRSAPPPPPTRLQAAPVISAQSQAPPLPPNRVPPAPAKPPVPRNMGGLITEAAPATLPPPPPPPPMLPPPEPISANALPPPPPMPSADLDTPMLHTVDGLPSPPMTSADLDTPMLPAADDPRSALLASIKMGRQLKKVEPGSTAPVSNNNAGSGDIRGDLLGQIRQGIELRRVTPGSTAAASQKPDMSEEATLAGALARALAERLRANYSDSSSISSEDEEDFDDEWED